MVSPVSPAGVDCSEGLAIIGAGVVEGGGGAVLATGCAVCDQGILIDEIVLHPAVLSITSAMTAAAGTPGRVRNSELLIGFS